MVTNWEEAVLASMTRDQLVLFGQMHERYREMKAQNERLKRLAFGAGMALAGVIVEREWGADLSTAQDLIAQMLEEPS